MLSEHLLWSDLVNTFSKRLMGIIFCIYVQQYQVMCNHIQTLETTCNVYAVAYNV